MLTLEVKICQLQILEEENIWNIITIKENVCWMIWSILLKN